MKVFIPLVFTIILAAIVLAEPVEKRDIITEIRPGLRYDIMPSYYDYYKYSNPYYYGHGHHHRYPPHYPYEKVLYYPGYDYYGKK